MINLLNMGTVTSDYGKRQAPTKGASTLHRGVDIVLDNGKVPSVTAGTVTASGYNSSMGNYVKIKDSDGNIHTYMHLNSNARVKSGESIKEGQIIGYQGETGVATGVHLHYQVQNASGTFIDPADYFKNGSTGYGEADEDNGGGIVSSILSPIFKGVIIIVVAIIGVWFFLKAFDISVPTPASVKKLIK